MVVCDYRSALRFATAPLHEEIDALFGAFDLGDHDGLTRFLMAQAIGMQACQPRVMRFGRRHLGCDPPDYMQILKADLAVLGIDTEQLPRRSLPGATADAGGDAGVFYVVAGSRMGAAVLRRRATAPTPGGPAGAVCGFFAVGDGPAIWRRYGEWLKGEGPKDRTGATPSSLPAMIDAATATFQLFAEAARLAASLPVPGRLIGNEDAA